MIGFPATMAATSGATAGAAAGGVPSWIIALALGILESQGSGDDQGMMTPSQMRESQAGLINMGIRPPYQRKNLPILDEMLMKLLPAQVQRSGNWGYQGGGQQMDLSFILEILDKIGKPRGRTQIGEPNPNPPGDTLNKDSLTPRDKRPLG